MHEVSKSHRLSFKKFTPTTLSAPPCLSPLLPLDCPLHEAPKGQQLSAAGAPEIDATRAAYLSQSAQQVTAPAVSDKKPWARLHRVALVHQTMLETRPGAAAAAACRQEGCGAMRLWFCGQGS